LEKYQKSVKRKSCRKFHSLQDCIKAFWPKGRYSLKTIKTKKKGATTVQVSSYTFYSFMNGILTVVT